MTWHAKSSSPSENADAACIDFRRVWQAMADVHARIGMAGG